MEYIRGDKGTSGGAKSKNNLHKSKLHKHVNSSEEKGTAKKQRARSKGKNTNLSGLQKSSSLDEMSSTAKLEDFVSSENAESKVPLRTTKSNADRTRERRSWGNTEVSLVFLIIFLH